MILNNKRKTTNGWRWLAACCLMTMLPIGAIAQKLIAQKTTIDVGKTGFQQPVTAVFEFRNKSIRRLKIEKVDPDCNCTVVEYPKTVVGMGERFQIRMTYDARMLGHFDKQAAIISNGTKKPVYIRMKGVVLADYQDVSCNFPIEIGELRTDKNELEFDNVNKGEHPIQQIQVYNNSDKPCRPNLMHLPSYLSATVVPEKINPGRTATISVTLQSEKVGGFGLTQSSIYLATNPGDKATADNLVGVSTVLLPAFEGMTSELRKFAPNMQLSKEKVDVVMAGKSKKSDVVNITNTGRSELKISSIQLFTVGLRVSLNKRILKPGETARLKITVLRDQIKKARTKPRILMITNDPDHSKVVIPVSAT